MKNIGTLPQARALLELLQCRTDIAPSDLADVTAFVSIPDLPFLERCREVKLARIARSPTLLWLVALVGSFHEV